MNDEYNIRANPQVQLRAKLYHSMQISITHLIFERFSTKMVPSNTSQLFLRYLPNPYGQFRLLSPDVGKATAVTTATLCTVTL